MFTRQQLKEAAKNNLRKNWGAAIGASVLTFLPFIVFQLILFILEIPLFFAIGYSETGLPVIAGGLMALIFTLSLVTICVSIIIIPVNNVGFARFFLKMRGSINPKATEPYAPLREGYTGNIVKILIPIKMVQYLICSCLYLPFIVLFFVLRVGIGYTTDYSISAGTIALGGFAVTVLFLICIFIPGIPYLFKYSAMMPFVLAADASASKKYAKELCAKLMKGHWGEILVLYLSFFGWYFISLYFTGGLLQILYVKPYLTATLAEFYSCRRAELINSGELLVNELPSFGSDWYSMYNTNGPFQTAAPSFTAPKPYPQTFNGNTGGFVGNNPNDYMGFAGGAPVRQPPLPLTPKNTPPDTEN